MAQRHLLQYRDLIADLYISEEVSHALISRSCGSPSTHHMLSPGHETLVDDLRRIIATGIDVHTFLHNRVRTSAQCLSGLVSARLNLRLLTARGLCRHCE